MTDQPIAMSLKDRLHEQTAQISWKELQHFFARGVVLWVCNDCDLIEVAASIAQDETDRMASLIEAAKVAPVSNDQARQWYAQDTVLWSVVVAPYVLVQCGTQ